MAVQGVDRTGPDDGSELYRDELDGSGWLFFAGTILGLAGFMRIIDSIWAFRYNGAIPDGLKDGVLGDNLNNYAWTWLIVGILLILSSFAVLTRSQFARWVGLFAAAIGGLERDDVDAVLPRLVAHLRRARHPRVLRARPLRRPRTRCRDRVDSPWRDRRRFDIHVRVGLHIGEEKV